MMCTGGTTGRPKGVLWRQSDIYVSSMVGADHACAHEIHDKVRGNAGAAVVRRLAADARGRHVDGVRGDHGRPARRALRRPQQARPALGVGDRRAREGGHDDHGRGRLRRAAGRELQRGSYDLSSLYAIGTGGAATNPKYQASPDWNCCPSSPSSTVTAHRRPGTWDSGTAGAEREPTPSRCARADWFCPRTTAAFLPPASTRWDGSPGKGRIPLGYFNDPDATRKTFPEIDGRRVVISGDRAAT